MVAQEGVATFRLQITHYIIHDVNQLAATTAGRITFYWIGPDEISGGRRYFDHSSRAHTHRINVEYNDIGEVINSSQFEVNMPLGSIFYGTIKLFTVDDDEEQDDLLCMSEFTGHITDVNIPSQKIELGNDEICGENMLVDWTPVP